MAYQWLYRIEEDEIEICQIELQLEQIYQWLYRIEEEDEMGTRGGARTAARRKTRRRACLGEQRESGDDAVRTLFILNQVRWKKTGMGFCAPCFALRGKGNCTRPK
jgi:hypothetical protein